MVDEQKLPPEDLPELLERGGIDTNQLRDSFSTLHPVDLVDILNDVSLDERIRLFGVLGTDTAAQVLASMPPDSRTVLTNRLDEGLLARVIDRMPDYAVADIIEPLPAEKGKAIMARLVKHRTSEIQRLRQFEPHTAGGRMTRNFVAVPDTFTSGATIRAIQGAVDSHTVDFVYVVDDHGRLRGVSSLAKLMIHGPDTPIANFMRQDVTFVGALTDQEEVAAVAQKYRLRAVPVVDDEMRLIGVVTLQDIIDVIRHEADEDIMKLAGAEHVDPVRAPLQARLKARLPWLAAAMTLELFIALIMKGYEETLRELALAFFIPVIMAMGGSLGLQSSTMVVRGLATGEITLSKTLRVVLGELRLGLVVGLLAGLATGAMALLLELGGDGAFNLGIIVFVSMMISLTIAATLGALTPLLLQKLKFDPAIASGPFITATNDVVNVTLYLTIATFLIVR